MTEPRVRRAWLLAALPLAAPSLVAVSGARAQTPPSAAVTVLLGQAAYWRAHGQAEQAGEALRRALQLDPANAEALAQQAQDTASSSNAPVLAQARALALAGKAAEAVSAYRSMFNGDAPPPALAAEFYQTLAATRDGQTAAETGLAATLRANPNDLHTQLAYAQVLTYRQATRTAGIERLAALTRYQELAQPARDAWRQALLWAGNSPQMLDQVDTYLKHYPGDTELGASRKAMVTAQTDPAAPLRANGYQAMQARRNAEAERAFSAVLAQNPDDVDSLAMLSILQRERGHGAEAKQLLDRALALAPDRRDELLAAATPAAKAAGPSATTVRGAYAKVGELADRGDYAAAQTALRKLMGHRPAPGSWVQLGYIQLRAGDLESAAASFHQAMAANPRDSAAENGLADVLQRQGDMAGAMALYGQSGNAAGLRGLQQTRAETLRDQAHHADSLDEKIRLYRLALAANPADPWLRLEFARALSGAQQPDEARAVMAPVLEAPRPGADAARAGIYYADGAGDPALVLSLASRLAPRDRTAEIAGIATRAEVAQELQDATDEPSLADTRDRMLDLAGKPDPTGARGVAFAQALIKRGDKPGARAVIRAALASGPATPQQRIAYAGMLVAAGYPGDAQSVSAALPAATLNPLERSTLQSVQVSAAVERADQLNDHGEAADAYDQLAPRLAQDPHNPALNMALARLYQAKQQPRTALQIDEGLLRDNPDDLTVHVAAISAALGAGELGHATVLARDTKALFPDEPGAWMAAAQVAQAHGDHGHALADLRTARKLRAQQLSGQVSGELQGSLRQVRYAENQLRDTASDAAIPDEPVTRGYQRDAQSGLANAPGPQSDPALNALINQSSASLPPGTRAVTSVQDGAPPNPFRAPAAGTPDEPNGLATLPGEVRPQPPPDPVTAEIDRRINQVSADIAPEATVSLALRGRSGPSGLASLYDLSAPVEATYSPAGYGKLKLAVTPEYIDAGVTSAGNLAEFGTNPLVPAGGVLRHGQSSATGVGLGVGYNYEFASADIGSTPLGFLLTSVVGGIELAPQLATNLTLRATLDRRAVTDSLLSYAGEKDPRTGASWGGVTRDHVHLQLEGAAGKLSYYAGTGGGLLTGQNVRDNTEVDASAGVSLPVWKTDSQEIRTGLDLVYFTYRHNLQNFTFGSGGYFSPENFIAGLIPVTYSQTVSPDLKFSIGGSLGVQSFGEKSTAVFQAGGLQQELLALAAAQPGTTTTLSGTHVTGIAGGAHGDVDYRALEDLHIGATAGFDRSGNFTEGTGLVYARYQFSGQ